MAVSVTLKSKSREVTGYPLILGYLGVFIFLVGIICLIPLIMLCFYPEDAKYASCFLVPGVAAIIIGYVMQLILKGRSKSRGNLQNKQGAILIVLLWLCAIFISSVPFCMTGEYTFTQAVFESASGYSTTGSTVYNYASGGHIFLFYRSLLLFFGGIGLVLIVTSAISDRYGLKLYTAEGHTDKLLPNLVKSARLILSIYLGYIILGMFLFVACGMPWFDAINHSMAAVATGGFSTQANNIGYYNSLSIEIVAMVLMLLGATSFVLHLCLFKGKFSRIWKHSELRFALGFLIIMIPVVILCVGYSNIPYYNGDWGIATRIGIFQLISSMTTTGFTNLSIAGPAAPQNFSFAGGFPTSALILLILTMIIGGGFGSTAGAIKQYRIVIFGKTLLYSIRDKMTNKRIVRPEYVYRAGQKAELTKEEFRDCSTFVLAYIVMFILGTFIFTCFGHSIGDSAFEFASSLGGVGLSSGIIVPNAHPMILWTGTLGMFFGRLEIIVIFIAFSAILTDIFKRKPKVTENINE